MRIRTLAFRVALLLGVLLLMTVALLYWIGAGGPGERWEEGTPISASLSPATIANRASSRIESTRTVGAPTAKQILFGDLHVHSTFSLDAFAMALPVAGGEGARPISHACDFARFCSGLDFWSINDHAVGLPPWKWEQTVDAIRQCDAIAGETHDVTAFLGWEWTQVGLTPKNHYGHKNVVLRGLSDEEIPDRPIAAKADRSLVDPGANRIFGGLLGVMKPRQDIFDLILNFDESHQARDCPANVPVRDQAPGCRDSVATPAELFTRLDDWGFDSIVIPHGTTWGAYTPPGSSWEKQLAGKMHDPARQTLIEVFSGHGNAEEYRAWRAVEFGQDGRAFCPAPSAGHLSGCWRAGELVAERCLASGESQDECVRREFVARQNFVDAGLPGHLTVPGATPNAWLDADQCQDCFQPAFRYRPASSAQAILALRNFEGHGPPRRFEMGFIASSDNHSARPGTGYKEFGRSDMTETRIMHLGRILANDVPTTERPARSIPFEQSGQGFTPLQADAERGGSFFGTGGLVAVHATGRDRDAIWAALERKEVYGTSGPQMLLWFDLLNSESEGSEALAMGGETAMSGAPAFRVRAAGSFEQLPGCPSESETALGPERLEFVCGGECDHPSDIRRPITRIEVVRIRPQNHADEPLDGLIEDPWRVIPCDPLVSGSGEGCIVEFTDSEFEAASRDTLYYVRAIESPSLAVGADAQRCTRDAAGRCTSLDACGERPADDDCLAITEERAWSSPIFVAHVSSVAQLAQVDQGVQLVRSTPLDRSSDSPGSEVRPSGDQPR